MLFSCAYMYYLEYSIMSLVEACGCWSLVSMFSPLILTLSRLRNIPGSIWPQLPCTVLSGFKSEAETLRYWLSANVYKDACSTVALWNLFEFSSCNTESLNHIKTFTTLRWMGALCAHNLKLLVLKLRSPVPVEGYVWQNMQMKCIPHTPLEYSALTCGIISFMHTL